MKTALSGALQQKSSMGQRKNLSPRQESNPSPPEHRVGALPTELRELMVRKIILTEFICLLTQLK